MVVAYVVVGAGGGGGDETIPDGPGVALAGQPPLHEVTTTVEVVREVTIETPEGPVIVAVTGQVVKVV
jgi:hypothetical protein